MHGRIIPGKSAAALRHRAYQSKMQLRADRVARTITALPNSQSPLPPTGWVPLGPVPLASDATGSGFQDYHQVAGRATAVAIDPADPSGNTLYIGGAQGGVWKSTNAALSAANDVSWTAIADNQATLSIGSIAIQPGNSSPANSVIIVGTGEADNSADSYFGLGMLRSTNGGNTWTLIPTANAGTLSFSGLGVTRMAFSTASPNTVVAAMAAASEGVTDGALTAGTYRGLYTSINAGQSWTYDSLFSGGAAQATSATSVVYNAAANSNAGLFFAAVRYQGFYSSPDGLTWTRLANQPGASGVLSTTACPQNYSTSCPIYRGEITVVPGRNEMYVWFVSTDADNNLVDQGIWQSTNGGASWVQISDSGIVNCGDVNGCGVEQGFYNLELLAVPDGTAATDLYAGAINLYKCSITSINPSCSGTPFINLTHVYGCSPIGAPAHVHPDQHAMAYAIPMAGSEAGSALMYFANDGGIYRALNGFTGLATGSCSGTNEFDDLNQNLGSMTQFVSFSQSASDGTVLLGGTQDNGSPATAAAAGVETGWRNVLGGDGGYNAIDPNTGTWFGSNPDTGFGGLNIQECSSGTSCDDNLFNVAIGSSDLGGDDGSFYFPYILDPQSATALLVGTCRVWSGPRSGGAFTLLSLNFDTLGIGTCAGTEVNVIRSLAAGGPVNANGSQVIYATTDGPGPNNLSSPIGGNVWVTTNAAAISGTSSTFANVTLNGPGASSINPNQFPISSVAMDTSDTTGNTAYVAVMGFTGGPEHVWQTTNAGANWTDFTGTAANALPDSPVNAVVVDPSTHILYVGTDVGVFESSTSSGAWTEVGSSGGFLPNVAVTALAIFNSDCEKLLRASTYGRGVWQFSLPVTTGTPDFCLSDPAPFPTVNAGSTTTQGAINIAAVNGFSGAVNLACSTEANGSCGMSTSSLQSLPATVYATVNAAQLAAGSYQLSVQGTSGPTTHALDVPFNVADFHLSGTQSLNITAGGQAAANLSITPSVFYAGSVNGSCNITAIAGATCTISPVNPIPVNDGSPEPVALIITVPSSATPGIYNVTLAAQDLSGFPSHSFTTAVTVPSAAGSDFQLATTQAFPASVDAGSQTTAKISITPNYSGTVTASCDATSFSGQCSITPANPIQISSGILTVVTLTVNIPNSAAPQPSNSYSVNLTVQDLSEEPSHAIALPLTVIQDFTIGSLTPPSQTIAAGQSASFNFSILPVGAVFAGSVSLSCSGGPEPLCNFTPNPVTPGNNSVAVVMTIATTSSSATLFPVGPRRANILYAFWMVLPALALLGTKIHGAKRSRRILPISSLLGLFLVALLLVSCGGAGSNGGGSGGGGGGGGGGGQQQGTQPGTYPITVTGTSAGLSHQAPSTVNLIVNAQ